MMNRMSCAALLVMLAQTAGAVELFNGRDFTGWELQTTPAAPLESVFHMLPGGVVASNGKPSGFLATLENTGPEIKREMDQTRDEVSSWFGDDQAVQRRQFDEARHGARDSVHRGRGPKGYTRSDDRIREDVNDRLTDDHFLDASEVEVRVANGEVTLTGHVAHRDAKRRAEDLADHVAGVKHVQNNLRVQEQHASGGAGSVAASQATAAQTGGQAAAAKSN